MLALGGSGRELVEALLAELLPLDDERRTELVAQAQLGILALTDDTLRPAAIKLSGAVDLACRIAIEILAESGGLGAGRDRGYQAVRLRALVDGIAMQGLWKGTPDDSAHLRDTLTSHLDELASPDASASPERYTPASLHGRGRRPRPR